MPNAFNELYRDMLKDVFLEQAQHQLDEGVDGMAMAEVYADQGKTEFTLALLLLLDAPDEIKREILARAYEQSAVISEGKAEEFFQRYHRPFPLVKLEAQKDRLSARQVREGRAVRRGARTLNLS